MVAKGSKCGDGWIERWSIEDYLCRKSTLSDTIVMDRWIHALIYFSRLIECTTQRINPKIYHGIWVIIMCQYKFINYNISTTLVGHVDNWEGYVCVEAAVVWEISLSSSQFLLTSSHNK